MRLQRIMQLCVWLGLAALAGLPAGKAWALIGTPVASVSLAVGPVFRQANGSAPHRVQIGQALFEGDRLLTGSDAMALVVFRDEARVSLRADSEIRILRYRLPEANRPADMRLELVRGAIRQISGSVMRIQPERYRLNTPVAAIGVRGTDFLAKASSQSVETYIQEGSIVLLSLGNGCAHAPDSRQCNPIASLSDKDASRYLSLTAAGELEKRGVQPQELERLFGIRMARVIAPMPLASAASPVVQGPAPSSVPLDLLGAPSTAAPTIPLASTGSAADLASARANETLVEKSSLSTDPSQPPSVQPPAVVEPTPPIALPTQLVWGRFSSASDLPFKLPVSYEEASTGRHVTVGEISQYALWRQGSNGPLDPGLRGVISYQLVAGEASFQALGASVASLAELRSASLSIDFDRSAFDSSFSVFHSVTGDIQIAAGGRLNDEGLFNAVSGTARVAGAVSRDGKEAGAQFSKDIPSGTVRGISLFRARP